MLVLNAIVLVIKIVVGVRTGALTVLGAALESGLDMLNNVIGIALVAVASRAPDEDHPYGHDKFETLGALGIVGFLSISCFELLREGRDALLARRPPHHVDVVEIGFIAATLVVNVFVVWYERRRGRELGAPFSWPTRRTRASDILVTLMALASLALARIGWPASGRGAGDRRRADHRLERASDSARIDPGARGPARRSTPAELRSVVLAVPEIRDVRNVRSRSTASGQLFAEVTIGVSGATPVDEAHRLADAVEAAIEREFGTSEVTVHIEPA